MGSRAHCRAAGWAMEGWTRRCILRRDVEVGQDAREGSVSEAVGPRLERWMSLVGEAGYDGWLVADFRWNNPLFARLLGLQSGILSRRCFLWLPAPGRGEPCVLASAVDGHAVSSLDCQVTLYGGFEEMSARLGDLLRGQGQVAMEYVELGRLPTVSRVDAGLVELIRGYGVAIQSSGRLVSALEAWDERQRALHDRAARGVDAARRRALDHCAAALAADHEVTEGSLAALILASFADDGLEPGDGPDVGVNAHSADPHYSISGTGAVVGRDSVLLIDLWARVRDAAGGPYADSTWMAYTGATAPPDVLRAFTAVRDARDAALAAIVAASDAGWEITGRAVDRAARTVIEHAGLADHLIHRTGHSLAADHVHGMGTNLDDVEFPDDRPLLPWTGFTVEPGLYWPGQYGLRLEVSAILEPGGPRVTTESQTDLTLMRP